jgi:hypothetical protein
MHPGGGSGRRRYHGVLPPLQEQFLNASIALATRAARIRRAAVAGTITFLLLLVVAAAVALVTIREAEQPPQPRTARRLTTQPGSSSLISPLAQAARRACSRSPRAATSVSRRSEQRLYRVARGFWLTYSL